MFYTFGSELSIQSNMSTQNIFVLETTFQEANSAMLTISCPVDKINDIMSIIVDYNNNNKNTIPITPTKEKHETKLIQKINLSVISSLLNGGVKAPRRALDTLDDIKF